MHIHVLNLCRKFELIPIKIVFFTNFKVITKLCTFLSSMTVSVDIKKVPPPNAATITVIYSEYCIPVA